MTYKRKRLNALDPSINRELNTKFDAVLRQMRRNRSWPWMSEDEHANQGTAMMRSGLIWFGRISLLVGALLIAANVAMNFIGLSASYNIGDPSKDQFVLISFWHIGAALTIIGVGAIFAGTRN